MSEKEKEPPELPIPEKYRLKSVLVPSESGLLSEEYSEWLVEKIKAPWFIINATTKGASYVVFDEPNDALFFKLRFGDKLIYQKVLD